jgi:hypothetical protein
MQTPPRPPNKERRFLPVLKQRGFRPRTSVKGVTLHQPLDHYQDFIPACQCTRIRMLSVLRKGANCSTRVGGDQEPDSSLLQYKRILK